MVTKSPEYTKAVADVQKLSKRPPEREMLPLYGLYKVAEGTDLAKTEADEEEKEKKTGKKTFGWTDFAKKSMRAEWKKNVEERKLSVEDAQKEYVQLVDELKNKYGFSG